MSVISQFYRIPCESLTLPSQKKPLLISKSPIISSSSSIPCFSINSSSRARREIKSPAASDEAEWPLGADGGATAVADSLETVVEEEIKVLKKQLIESFYGTDRGLKTSAEARNEIEELVNQLESKNPNPVLSDALSLLNGKWIVAYTSVYGLFPLLSRATLTLPLVKVEEISETINSEDFIVENSVQFAGPLATTSISTNSKFEIHNLKRVQVKFEEGIIGTPQPTDSTVIPDNVELLGQKMDLLPVKGMISSIQDTASSVVRTISNQPPLKFNISERVKLRLLATYIDEELRISRSDTGIVIVFLKEGSDLLSSWLNS